MSFRDWLLDWFFPRKCAFCGGAVKEDLPCEKCQQSLPWLTGKQAEGRVEFVDKFACALIYQGDVRRCIRKLKFSQRVAKAKTLGILAAQCAQDHFPRPFDLITWVPLSPDRERERGFDQSRLIAREVAQALDLPLTPTLSKRRGVPRQSSLSGLAARRGNVLGAFSLLPGVEVSGRRILLVDDVITTGATVSECARVLCTAGAASVCAVAAARGGMNKEKQKRRS